MEIFGFSCLHSDSLEGVIVEHLYNVAFILFIIVLNRYFGVHKALSNKIEVKVFMFIHFLLFKNLFDSGNGNGRLKIFQSEIGVTRFRHSWIFLGVDGAIEVDIADGMVNVENQILLFVEGIFQIN